MFFKLLMVLLLFNFLFFTYSSDLTTKLNCSSSTYFPDECRNGTSSIKCICGEYNKRIYLGDVNNIYDVWIPSTTGGKERILKTNSYEVTIDKFNGAIINNGGWGPKSNWIPKEADKIGYKGDKPVLAVIKEVEFSGASDMSRLSRNVPIARINWKIYNYLTDGGNNTLSGSITWQYRTFNLDSNGNILSYNDILANPQPTKYNSSTLSGHYETYLLYGAWCGDGVVDSGYEQCDNGIDNWDGNGNPVVRNGIVCNTSCQVEQPSCGVAEGNYQVSDTDFRGNGLPNDRTNDGRFCSNYSELVGDIPSFPSPGSTTSWTCKLGNQTKTCNASRDNCEGPECESSGSLINSCGSANGTSSDTKPSSGLCTAGDDTAVWLDDNLNNGYWNWKCGNELCYAEKPCAIAGTCSSGSCGPLNGQTIYASDNNILSKFSDPESYYNDFCSNGSILSYSYDPNIEHKKFTWYCGPQVCSANVNYNIGKIKIYGSYSGTTWACSECNGFDNETWQSIQRRFLSDYDTEYTRSIMSGDYLPFGWILPEYDTKYVNSCNGSNVGKYNKNTVKVKFKALNRNGNLVYQTLEYNGFAGGVSLSAFLDNSVLGQSYVPADKTKNFSYGENTIKGYITYRQKCESYIVHHPAWDETRYRWTGDILYPTEFASEKFTLTDSYLLQLGTTLTKVSNVDLYFNGNDLSSWGILTSSTPYGNYSDGELTEILGKFIEKYKKYAIGSYNLLGDETTSFKKVLTQEVYYKNLDRETWVIPSDAESNIPTTVIIENGDVIIDGGVKGPLMLVVKNGKIKINNSKMNIQTVLDGYYITDKGFEVIGPAVSDENILNQNPSSSRWYADGRLKIKGVLIGPNAEDIYKRRRSVLKNWFRAGYGPSWAIKHGASLTITSNPNLWINPPVGSKDLFQMIMLQKGF